MSNEEKDKALYRYPNSRILRNKLKIRQAERLDEAERKLVTQRLLEDVPKGNFDLTHLRSIHKHLFQDIYEWAGELRQVDIAKSDWFLPYDRIEMGVNDVHKRLRKQNFLIGLDKEEFSIQAGHILGDVNYAHPFREGNGRTQTQYLKQLCEQAGYPIDLTRLSRDSWIDASIKSTRGDYKPMVAEIRNALF